MKTVHYIVFIVGLSFASSVYAAGLAASSVGGVLYSGATSVGVSPEAVSEDGIQADVGMEGTNTVIAAETTSEIKSDVHTDDVQANHDAVSLSYTTHAKLFGFIPVVVPVTAEINTTGEVTLRYPWYRIFLTADTATLQGKLQAVARATLFPATAANVAGTTTGIVVFSPQTQASLLLSLHSVLKEYFEEGTSSE